MHDVANVRTGVAKNSKGKSRESVKLPYLRVANVQDGHLDLSEIKTIRIRRDELDGYRLRKDDVVLTEGGDFDKLGQNMQFLFRRTVEDNFEGMKRQMDDEWKKMLQEPHADTAANSPPLWRRWYPAPRRPLLKMRV